MKKNKKYLRLLLLSLFTVVTLLTCKPSLGGQVDIYSPEGAITYPDTGETPIRGSFVIKGTAKDDGEVKSISVSFKNVDTGWISKSYPASIQGTGDGSFVWVAEIDNEFRGRFRDNHPLVKEYPLPDGTYTALVTIVDSNDRKTKLSREYTIDNTPPVFIVSRPSTIASGQDTSPVAEPYGAVFLVVGQAEDKNKIEDLTLKVGDENSGVEISKKFVGKNINEQMAEAVKDADDNYTDKLYLHNHHNTHNNSSPKIKAHLFLTDNARSYKGSAPEGTGNTSEWYYLRDNNMRSVLAKGYTADIINDYFAGKKGSAFSFKKSERLLASLYDANNTESQSVKAILENSRILIEIGPLARYSVFTLNPDKSPGFKVANASNLPMEVSASLPEQNLPKPSSVFFQDGTPPTLILDLIGNRDETPLVENYSEAESYKKSKIVINLYKCNEEVSYTASGSVKKLNVQPEVSPAYSFKFEDLQAQDLAGQGGNPPVVALNGSNKLTVSWNLPADFKQGHYLVKVEGKDTGDNDFLAYNNNNSAGGVYVVHFRWIGENLLINPEEPSGYVNKDFVVRANVFNLSGNPNVRYKIDAQAGESDTQLNLKNLSGTEYESASIPISSVSEGVHVVHFWANDDKNQEVRAKKEFIKDTTAPVPVMTFPPPTEDQMGTIRIMGTVSDDGAGVNSESTKYIIGKRDSLPAYNSSDWKPMDKSTPVSWEFTYNLDSFADSPDTYGTFISGSVYGIPVYILTEDKIGNKSHTEKIIRFDKDGSKPVMTIQSPQQSQVLGGSIQIFGTGTARTGVVGEVYIQFSKNGTFNSQDDGTFGGKDWYNGGNGQAIQGTASGGSNWQITINENGEFNNPSTDPNHQNWDVYFRVRAKNKDTNALGLWTSPVKITIDKAYPTVGSPEPLKIVNTDGSTPQNYAQDMWITEGKKLTGSLYDEAGIKALSISSSELFGSVTYNLQRAVSEGWIAEDTAHAPNPATGAKNYKLQIPLTIQESLKRKGNLSIKIKIVENTPKALYSETTVRMRFDVTKPAVAGGTWIVKSASALFTGGNFTANLTPAKKELYRVLVDDKVYEVDSITGTRVTLKNAASLIGNFNYGIVERPEMVYDDGSDYQITGIAADTVTGVQRVKASLKVADTETSVEMTRNDNTNKITQERGDMVSFQGSLNTATVKNGEGTLTITAYDERNNEVSETITNVKVKNKPVEIKKLVFRTDLSDNGSYDGGEEFEIADFGSLNTEKDFSGEAEVSSNFTFKNPTKSELEVTLKGGYGANARVSLHKEGSDEQGNGNGTIGAEIVSANGTISASGEYTVILDLNGKLDIEDNTAKKLYLKVTDGSVSAPWYAQAEITVGLDAVDDVPPKGFIMPFFYNSDESRITKPADLPLVSAVYDVEKTSEGVITKVKEPLGHIELASVSALGNNHPSVSGKVKLRGIAYDNIRLKELKLSGPGINATAAFTSGQWSGNLKVVKNGLSNTGHYVEWEYEWNTGAPALNQTVTLTVKDAADPDLTSGAGETDGNAGTGTRNGDRGITLDTGHTAKKHQFIRLYEGEKSYLVQVNTVSADGKKVTWNDTSVPTGITTYRLYNETSNKTTLSVNVVPYITEIETPKRINSGLNKNTLRSSDGKYSIIKGTTADFITVKGFNLSSPVVRLVKENDLANATETAGEGLTATESGSGFTLKNDLSKSGYLEVFAGTSKVRAINNINNNDKVYNKEADLYVLKNKTLNDNRYLRVFDMKKTAVRNGYYPEMIMEGDDPVFGLINPAGYQSSYGKTLTFSGPTSQYQLQRIKFDSRSGDIVDKGTAETKVEYIAGAITIDQVAMAKDESNKYHYVSVHDYTRAGMMYAYDRYAETETSASGNRGGWVPGSGYSNYKGKYAGEPGINALALDPLHHKSTSILERYVYPKIIAKGQSDTSDGATVYIAYYDTVENTNTKKGIKFRSFKVGNALNGGSRNMHGTIKSNFEGYKVTVETNTSGARSWKQYENSDNANGRQNVADGGSRFFDMGITSDTNTQKDKRVVIVYYDEDQGKLKLKYSSGAVDGSNPLDTIVWVESSVSFPEYVGQYVSMDIDSNGGIHIAAFDSSNGDLMYCYLPGYDSAELKTALVDAAFSVGHWTQVKVNNNKPYIAYYNSSETGQRSAIKLAVAKDNVGTVKNGVDSDGFVTGRWECMTVPSLTPAQGGTPKFKKVNLGFDTAGRPVLGYLGGNIEFGSWLDE
ncbi:hypothetical protein E4O00_00175 [Treponema sp. OMZ 788]|uniref:hypothetical protein n=1 Tax=Treponema sp. OMZ 788 TaxID=2563664 RepID=UPI0020A55D9F|nr:hypothetical protein [Treponema sp. OMZ 788]UTC64708.1 hypothetical protein E4O00_00175 [Treponema sp. OMZ 788]